MSFSRKNGTPVAVSLSDVAGHFLNGISPDNRVPFSSPQAAEQAGYIDRRTIARDSSLLPNSRGRPATRSLIASAELVEKIWQAKTAETDVKL